MQRGRPLVQLSCLLALIGACAPSAVARRIESVGQVAANASKAGAKNCAPEELALARVHLEFARLELSQGEAGLADRHLTLAEPNAKAALRLSESSECLRPRDGARRARAIDTSSRLFGAVGETHDLGRGAP